MRVTENMFATRFLNSITNAQERIATLQTQIASGKRVQQPSDDPQATDAILRLQTLIASNDQYATGTAEAQSMMETTTDTLGNAAEVLTQIKELLVKANNGANTTALGAFAESADSLLTEMVDLANTRFNGKYILGGTNTLQQPFTLNAGRTAVAANPNGITGTINMPIGEGVTQASNIDGQQALQGTAIFDLIIRVRDALRAGTVPTTADMDSMSTMVDYVTTQAGKAGSDFQSLETNQTFLASQKTQLQSLLSLQQDTDVASAVTELQRGQIMLDAALNATARVLPKSILDYMVQVENVSGFLGRRKWRGKRTSRTLAGPLPTNRSTSTTSERASKNA